LNAGPMHRLVIVLAACGLLWGCAVQQAHVAGTQDLLPPQMVTVPPQVHDEERSTHGPALDTGWKQRVISQDELSRLNEKDSTLTPAVCCLILARLNAKAHYHVSDDIRNGRSLKVPNNFGSYKHWTPMPRYLPKLDGVPKFILVVKDIPFLGWYAEGRLVRDSYICIGKSGERTEAGLFMIEEKDVNHLSRSYPNSYGQPAWMPHAMRIYGNVWIHAGDITGPNCSHGCVTLPLDEAADIFLWTDAGTPVLILESLTDLDRDLQRYATQFISHH
jgi:hypothetical protein